MDSEQPEFGVLQDDGTIKPAPAITGLMAAVGGLVPADADAEPLPQCDEACGPDGHVDGCPTAQLDDGLLEPGAALGVPLTRDELLDVIGSADCACAPGDPTCQDWLSKDQRWSAIASAVEARQVRKLSQSDSGLVQHAQRELAVAGNDDAFNATLVAAVHAFTSYGHSGASAAIAAAMLGELLAWRPLGPLTDDPDEWQHVGGVFPPDGVWQNRRDGEAFSHDGGRSYYLLREGGHDRNRQPLHNSKVSGRRGTGPLGVDHQEEAHDGPDHD